MALRRCLERPANCVGQGPCRARFPCLGLRKGPSHRRFGHHYMRPPAMSSANDTKGVASVATQSHPSPDHQPQHQSHPSPDHQPQHQSHPSPDHHPQHQSHPSPDHHPQHQNHPSPDHHPQHQNRTVPADLCVGRLSDGRLGDGRFSDGRSPHRTWIQTQRRPRPEVADR